ncbi:MAG: SAM-dependent methyltransferase [Verrucomicrobia bacterium]|nr:SAM-dependent methyltransferase [Verrucomicrobiota bacterium]
MPIQPTSEAAAEGAVELSSVEGRVLRVKNIDVLDGTPLLDIKPYIPVFDTKGEVRTGWYERTADRFPGMVSDNRFAGKRETD